MVYLIDASVFVFKAWYSIPADMTDPGRNPVNALYGFSRFLGDFLEDVQPRHVAVAFDGNRSQGGCVRTAIYPQYKANREPAPPELKLQFARCRAVARALGLADCADAAFEADDLIAALAARARAAGHRVTILSRDKDLAQVLQPGDVLWDYPSGRRIGYEDVPGVFGVRAEQIADFLALTGDAVDNIRGVRGIGPKTAAALLGHFAGIAEIYDNLEAVGRLKIRAAPALPGRLRSHRADVDVALQLTRVRYDAPVFDHPDALLRRCPDLEGLDGLYDVAGFGEALRRQARRLAAVT
ncbi:MAG: exodeoxyribonuclease IX [Gammaproteobacteria bacterium]|jgi:5'-3' exonuclease|nr:exodeoxyribonuclease IX [Gammaproteobacteria bacterium]